MAAKEMKVEELAVKVLMSARTVEKARQAKIGLPLNTCKRIASGLKMKLEDLV